ncbi:MAG: 50S ribosomal protein L32 [Deltaproteobacteria bacterium]|nr:50S ribosomal protein L32 [Deltaproteobacteria bacterium]
MPVPKKRVSRSQRDQRRAHDALTLTAAIESCPDCGAPKLRHRVCDACGSYRGKKIFADNDTASSSDE